MSVHEPPYRRYKVSWDSDVDRMDSVRPATESELHARLDHELGTSEVQMGRGVRESFITICGKQYENIGKEIAGMKEVVHELQHKLLGPRKEVSQSGTRGQPEPGGDMGVLDKIERSNARTYNDLVELNEKLRLILNRI